MGNRCTFIGSIGALMILSGCGNSVKASWMDGTGNMQSALIDADTMPADLTIEAREACGDRSFCQIFGWIDPAHQARQFPMLDHEQQNLSFAYKINRQTNFEESRFDCSKFKVPKASCL